MKKLTMLATIFILSCSIFSTAAEAYRCDWRNGHRVCWHEGTTIYHVYPNANRNTYVVYDRVSSPCYWYDGRRFCR